LLLSRTVSNRKEEGVNHAIKLGGGEKKKSNMEVNFKLSQKRKKKKRELG